MSRRVKSNRSCNESNSCNSQGNQLIVLSAIIASIIYQEVQNDDELETIGNLFLSIGGNIILAVDQRSVCNENSEKNNITDNSNNQDLPLLPNTNLPLRSQNNNSYNKLRKVKKIKKVKRKAKQIK